MNKTLTVIREKLSESSYFTEGQIRLSLVCRILQELGWDIWDPREVYSEFAIAPSGPRTKVDIALFAEDFTPSVFIAVRAINSMDRSQTMLEKQMRECNRCNPATFSVITDGKNWRFYLSNTGGEFAEKCYKFINLQEDALDEIENVFSTFLSKKSIANGNAKKDADNCMQAIQEEKVT
ncbi:MAG: hypothetical protein QGG87_04200 [Nitrospinota bacterium]|jgi:hypothetical protein|nr:hypothetical protein [Nitrospinota bacterium]